MTVYLNAKHCDLFDVLEYVAYAVEPVTREQCVVRAQIQIANGSDDRQREFLDFVLHKYIQTGVSKLDQDKLPRLLELKDMSMQDAQDILGSVNKIRETFIDFQKYLYIKAV